MVLSRERVRMSMHWRGCRLRKREDDVRSVSRDRREEASDLRWSERDDGISHPELFLLMMASDPSVYCEGKMEDVISNE